MKQSKNLVQDNSQIQGIIVSNRFFSLVALLLFILICIGSFVLYQSHFMTPTQRKRAVSTAIELIQKDIFLNFPSSN